VNPAANAVAGAANRAWNAVEAALYGAASGVLGASRTLIDAKPRIDQLQTAGDKVTFAMGFGGKIAMPIPRYVPFPVGVRAEYGYDATVVQIAPEPGATAPRYEVSFGKQLLAVATVDKPLPAPAFLGGRVTTSATAIGELGPATSDRVVMGFNSKNDAARAVQILGRTATAQAMRDYGRIASPTWPPLAIFQNPLRGSGAKAGAGAIPLPGGPLSLVHPILGPWAGLALRAATDRVADRLMPSDCDTRFLDTHTTGYRQSLNIHARGLLSTWVSLNHTLRPTGITPFHSAAYGVTPFVDVLPTVTRELTLPQGREPAKLSYSLSDSVALREADKLRVQTGGKVLGGGKELAKAEVNVSPFMIGEVGKIAGEAKATWKLTDRQAREIHETRGTSLPETSLFRAGDDLAPDRVQRLWGGGDFGSTIAAEVSRWSAP